MIADDWNGSDQRELTLLLLNTLLALVLGFTIGIGGGMILHLSRLIIFILSFGLSFAILLALMVIWTVITFFRKRIGRER